MKRACFSVLPTRDYAPGSLSTFEGEDEEGRKAEDAAFALARNYLAEGWDYVSIHKVVRD